MIENEQKDIDNEVKEEKTNEVTEEKVETPAEEVEVIEQEKVEQAQKAQKKAENIYYDLDSKYFVSTDEIYKELSDRQTKFMSEYNKGRRIQVIMTIVVFAFFLACLIVMFIGKKELNFLMYIFLGLAVVAFIASMVINSKFKKSSIDSIDSYVHSYFFILDCFSYSENEASNVKCSPNAKVEDSEVIESHYFDTILSINSRNRVSGSFKGHLFATNDVAVRVPETSAQVTAKKKDKIGFYGKYYAFDVKSDNSIIIIRKSNEGAKTAEPTYLDGYEEVTIEGLNENFEVYATDIEKAKELFTDTFKELLENLVIDKNLLDYFISLNPLGTKVALNYSDAMMSVPLQNKYQIEVVKKHLDDNKAVFAIVNSLIGE